MVDEENHDVASEPTGAAAVNRDRRPDPGVVEGEVVDRAETLRAGETPRAEEAPRAEDRLAPRRPNDERRSPAAHWHSAPLAV